MGISAAGGVGRATAELIVNGETSLDMYELDVSRFLGLHNNRKFLRDRVREVPGMHYGLQYPHHEFKTGRNLRMSPIYPKLREAGAVFGQVMGYERPTWFLEDVENDYGIFLILSNNSLFSMIMKKNLYIFRHGSNRRDPKIQNCLHGYFWKTTLV